MSTETTSTLSNVVKTAYNRMLLENLYPNYLFGQFGDPGHMVTLPNGTTTMEWRKWGNLSAATTPLTQGTTPAGSNHSVTLVTQATSQYGDFVTYSDVLDMQSIDPFVATTMELQGYQAAETLDHVSRDTLVAGTNIQYAGGVAGRSSVASSNKLSISEIKKAVRTLRNSNVPTIGGSYIGIIHGSTAYDLMVDSEFILTSQYAGGQALYAGEIGTYHGVRFLQTSNAKVFTGAGDSSIDVYASLIFGAHWFGSVKYMDTTGGQKVPTASGNFMVEMFLKPVGSSGSSDPLNQRGSVGWKVSHAIKILNQTCGLRIEHAVS